MCKHDETGIDMTKAVSGIIAFMTVVTVCGAVYIIKA